MVLEPIRSFFNPMVGVLSSSVYFSRSMHGEIVGGMGDKEVTIG